MAERIPIAFLAGLISVITPCVLPLVPGYLSAMSTVEANRLGERGVARRIVLASIPFFIGFTVVFVALGAGGQHLVGTWTQRVVLRSPASCSSCSASSSWASLPLAGTSRRAGAARGARKSGSSALLGAAFAVCAAPCIGTVLASILVLAGDSQTVVRGSVLLFAYSAGIACAFVSPESRSRKRWAHFAGCETTTASSAS